jgi:hypothetical protein
VRRDKPPRYRLISHPDVPDDLAALIAYGADAVQAARVALDDLAHGRVTGKALGERHVSGDLTGLASVKFDLPGSPTRRFRLVYADIDATTRGVLAVGVREEHAIYRLAVQRFQAREEGTGGSEPSERSSR